ncbi:MAG: phosphoribosylformylglycinamidine cyclo-ligase [Bacteroidetes bacterium]|nr:phosphoribosylformylglycinamidine cyclo-ligase [Bacteroidota bacterium]
MVEIFSLKGFAVASTYKKAGVDIDAGEAVIHRIKRSVRSTFTKNVLTDIGMFGAFYEAKFPGIKNPVLVSSVDGVGTKLKVAFGMKRYDTVGQDLVNHCVNDIAVCGAIPLYFMDYFATGKLAPNIAADVIGGFAKACKENHCSIIGGETAEMPGFYPKGEFDIAGTIVGVVDKAKIVNGKGIKKGDVLIGLPSTGLHTNGYSLARHVLIPKFSLKKKFTELNGTLGDSLLAVHRSYLDSIRAVTAKGLVKGMSHITGGGIIGNTMRIIPKGLNLKIDWFAWQRPFIYDLIQSVGQVPEYDMTRTFNLGIGLIVVVDKKNVGAVIKVLTGKKELPVIIGEVR